MVSSYSKQAEYGERTLNIRGIQAKFAQAPQVALMRDWRVQGHISLYLFLSWWA